MESRTNVSAILGRRLRELRKEQNLSQEALAEAANLNTTFVGSIERGQANPTLDTLCKLADALHIEIFDLLYTPEMLSSRITEDERLCLLLAEYSKKIRALYDEKV